MLGLRGAAARYNYLPFAAAQHQDVLAVLAAPENAAAQERANVYLEDVNRRAGSDTLYVMALDGRTLASSNWNSVQTFVGQSYANRPYFIDSRAGRSGMFYGIGTTTGIAGLFMAAPVRRSGVVIGVVAVKVSLLEIERAWAAARDPIMLSDAHGILFLGSPTAWLFQTTRPLMAGDLAGINATKQYGNRSTFAPVPWSADRSQGQPWYRVSANVGGQPREYLAVDAPWPELGWTLTVMSDHAPVYKARLLAWVLSVLIAGLLMLSWLYARLHVRRLTEHREARQSLELRVSERTAELREAHAFRKAMEDSLIVGMRARDLQGRIRYVNPALCEMTGYSAEELIDCLPPYPYWHPDDLEKHWQDNEATMSGRAALTGFESRMRHREGHEVFTMIYTAPLVDGDGTHSGWISSVVDISEQKRAEARQRVQDQQLQHAGRVANLGEMASTLAHELNQPLMAIATFSGVARTYSRQGQTALLEESLAEIQQQAKRSADIVRRFRDFIKQRTVGIEACDVNALVSRVLILLQPEIRAHRARVTSRLQANSPSVMGDQVLLEQVLLNLVLNGLQAMSTLQAELRQVEVITATTHDVVLVQVLDSGPGIAPGIAANLFEPFFTTKPDGLGLGLNICRTIIESHKGFLAFENRPGGGVIFSINLPLAPSTCPI